MKTTTTRKQEFIEIMDFNGLEPTIDPENNLFDDHLSIQLWNFIEQEITQAKLEVLEEALKYSNSLIMNQEESEFHAINSYLEEQFNNKPPKTI